MDGCCQCSSAVKDAIPEPLASPIFPLYSVLNTCHISCDLDSFAMLEDSLPGKTARFSSKIFANLAQRDEQTS